MTRFCSLLTTYLSRVLTFVMGYRVKSAFLVPSTYFVLWTSPYRTQEVCMLGWALWNRNSFEFKMDDTRLSSYYINKIGPIKIFFCCVLTLQTLCPFDPSILPYKFGLIFMGMKRKRIFFPRKKNSKWPTQKNWDFQNRQFSKKFRVNFTDWSLG